MEIILLAIIAGILAIRTVNDLTKGRAPATFIVTGPMIVVFIVLMTLIILGLAWSLLSLFAAIGIYLG